MTAPAGGGAATGSTMPREERSIPQWRALLEARWQARLRELTELALAYHTADAERGAQGRAQQDTQTLLRRAVGARRKLADVEEALGRLTRRRLRPLRAVRVRHPRRAAGHRARGPVLPALRRRAARAEPVPERTRR